MSMGDTPDIGLSYNCRAQDSSLECSHKKNFSYDNCLENLPAQQDAIRSHMQNNSQVSIRNQKRSLPNLKQMKF